MGSKHKATLAAEALMEGESDRLTRKCIDAALNGDSVAMRLCMERIYPIRKGRPVAFPLPPTGTAEGLAKAMTEIVRGASDGELTPDEGAAMATLLEIQRKSIELVEIEARLCAVEKAQAGK